MFAALPKMYPRGGVNMAGRAMVSGIDTYAPYVVPPGNESGCILPEQVTNKDIQGVTS